MYSCGGPATGSCSGEGGDTDGLLTEACFFEEGLYCSYATGTCQPLLSPGDDCDRDRFACGADLYCVQDSNGFSSCVPVSPTGGPCTGSSDCASTDFCNMGGGTCATREPLGADCSFNDQCREGYCDNSSVTTSTWKCILLEQNLHVSADNCVGRGLWGQRWFRARIPNPRAGALVVRCHTNSTRLQAASR
jgi:hypothetical protein